MKRKIKFRLLSVALMAALACHTHAESHLIDLNTGSIFDGVVSTKPLCTVNQDADGITVSYQFDYAYLSENLQSSPTDLHIIIPYQFRQ